jgi:hypothetical protein
MVAALASGIVIPAFAADPCTGFKWDVSKEHTLFGGPAATLTAGKDAASAPAIDVDRLYELKLTPQDQTAFVLPPGKKMLTDGAYAVTYAQRSKYDPGAVRRQEGNHALR